MLLNRKEKFRLFILQSEFDKRLARNGGFSLRKFALELGQEASVVSKYFRKKRVITDKSFESIIDSLKLDRSLLHVKEEKFYRSLSEMKLLKEDHQDILGNWHAFAILECLNLNNSVSSLEWLSEKTGLKKEVVSKVVERLFDIGAIVEENGKWVDKFENLTFIESEDMDNAVGRNFQKQILELSKDSIEKQPGEKKSHSNVIMAIDEKYVPHIKKKIREFRREINDFASKSSEVKTNVYNLQVNFHSILKNK